MSDYFIFDNVDTRNYEGILVYFNSVDATPKRVGEFIEIPNRNGSFFLDGGRYEDAVHTYDIIALSKEHASDLINALASKVGYFRLQDSFNPDEYYSAVLDSEIEPVVTAERDKLTFKIMFTRKPQRWLTSGETAVAVTSGDTLTNPTLFESGPLLEATGSGAIQFNGYEIDFAGVPYGEIVICPSSYAFHQLSETVTVTLDTSLLNSGDAIYPEVKDCLILARLENSASASFLHGGIGTTSNVLEAYALPTISQSKKQFHMYLYPDFGDGFVYGTSKIIVSSAVYNYRLSGTDYSETVGVTITYGGADTYTVKVTSTGTLPANVSRKSYALSVPTMYGDSTQPIQGVPIYIDCDLGEAYLINGTEYVSLNHRIDLGSELPKLASGSNTVTFDNTITELKITPRWWKV